jgi:PPK2 family polyphosphate:nucleotide phosphotransferase
MKVDLRDFRVPEGADVKLRKWPTDVKPLYSSKQQFQKLLDEHVEQLSAQQQLLYSSNSHAILLIFQAMDAAGKDGVIKHVMSGVNPQGCQVFSFKHPSASELQHDFLWRTTRDLPERGRIGIFNRSYYEEVLIVRVHPEVLAAEKISPQLEGKDIWEQRFEDIHGFERYLARNGVVVRKFFLNVSKDEQKRRFLKRLDEPGKNWKFSAADVKERQFWDDYMHAYEEMIRNTTSSKAPWYVVPADHKWYTHLVVAAAVVDALEDMDLAYPILDAKQRKQLEAARTLLVAKKNR